MVEPVCSQALGLLSPDEATAVEVALYQVVSLGVKAERIVAALKALEEESLSEAESHLPERYRGRSRSPGSPPPA